MQRPPPLTELTDAQRAEALRRFQILQPCLEDGISVVAVARQHHLPISTLRRWLRRYRADGLRASPGNHGRIKGSIGRCILISTG